MLLLRELSEINEVKIVQEGQGAALKHIIEGIFLQADIKNKNGRMYSGDILGKEVDRYVTEYVNNGRGLGELGHPTNPSINLDRVSHKITSIVREGSNFMGRAVILGTPMGNIVKNLMDEGVKIGVSSRGLGSLKESNGMRVVCEDFRLVTAADIVSDPSAPDAFVSNLMENKEWVWVNGNLVEHEVEIKNAINTLSKNRKLDEGELVRVFQKILTLM